MKRKRAHIELTITLTPSVVGKLKRQAHENGSELNEHVRFIIETWFTENLFESIKVGRELGGKVVAALDRAMKTLTGPDTEITARITPAHRASGKDKRLRAKSQSARRS